MISLLPHHTRPLIALALAWGAWSACDGTEILAPNTSQEAEASLIESTDEDDDESVPVDPGVSLLDQVAAAELMLQFVADPHINAADFDLEVMDGVATITARTTSGHAYDRANTLAQRIPNVDNVTMATPRPNDGEPDPGWPEPALANIDGVYERLDALATRRDVEPELNREVQIAGDRAASGDRPRTYRVQAGDNLSLIARRTMGDGNQWRRIHELNRSVIGANPERLQEGMELRIPQD